MLLDRVLRLAVRNFSTLFLVVFVVLIPLHLVYALFFHDVFAVRELHPAIAQFPESRMVRGVGRGDIAQARIWFWALAGLEVASIPLLLRPVRRVLVLDRAGRVPEASTAWRTMNEPYGSLDLPAPSLGVVLGCVGVGLILGGLVWLTLEAVASLLPDVMTGFTLALVDAASRSAGAAFVLTGLALRSRQPHEAAT